MTMQDLDDRDTPRPAPADLMDASLPPDPSGGWSCAIRTVPGAVVNHLSEGYLVHPSGVYDASGSYVAQAVHWRGRPLMTPPPLPEAPEPVAGRWLWAGVLQGHFGHFLTESLGRLWALDALEGGLDGIAYLPEKGFGADVPPALKSFQSRCFALLGIDLPIRILTRPSRFDCLEVPGPGFGIGPLMGGTAPFRRFWQARFGQGVAAAGGERLYISRGKLDASLGGILEESLLEKHLVQAGYEIFHPELHSLDEQIARFKAARHIIGLDGSALHLLALVARPEQRVAVIMRRSGPAPKGIVAHLQGFTGQAPLVIDVITRNWVRSDRKGADNFSFGQLDFIRLGEVLADHGFLPPGSGLPILSERRAAAAIAKIEERLRRKGLTFAAKRAPGAPPRPSRKTPEEREAKRAAKAARLAQAESAESPV